MIEFTPITSLWVTLYYLAIFAGIIIILPKTIKRIMNNYSKQKNSDKLLEEKQKLADYIREKKYSKAGEFAQRMNYFDWAASLFDYANEEKAALDNFLKDNNIEKAFKYALSKDNPLLIAQIKKYDKNFAQKIEDKQLKIKAYYLTLQKGKAIAEIRKIDDKKEKIELYVTINEQIKAGDIAVELEDYELAEKLYKNNDKKLIALYNKIADYKTLIAFYEKQKKHKLALDTCLHAYHNYEQIDFYQNNDSSSEIEIDIKIDINRKVETHNPEQILETINQETDNENTKLLDEKMDNLFEGATRQLLTLISLIFFFFISFYNDLPRGARYIANFKLHNGTRTQAKKTRSGSIALFNGGERLSNFYDTIISFNSKIIIVKKNDVFYILNEIGYKIINDFDSTKAMLDYVVRTKDSNLLNTLIKNIDVDAKDCYGNTPLHYAAEFGRIKMIKRFMKKGANVNIKDYNGNTPLMLTDNLTIKRLLMNTSIYTNSPNK